MHWVKDCCKRFETFKDNAREPPETLHPFLLLEVSASLLAWAILFVYLFLTAFLWWYLTQIELHSKVHKSCVFTSGDWWFWGLAGCSFHSPFAILGGNIMETLWAISHRKICCTSATWLLAAPWCCGQELCFLFLLLWSHFRHQELALVASPHPVVKPLGSYFILNFWVLFAMVFIFTRGLRAAWCPIGDDCLLYKQCRGRKVIVMEFKGQKAFACFNLHTLNYCWR